MYGPGSSLRARASASSGSSGTHSTSDSMLRATIAIGWSGDRPLSADSARTASALMRRAREAVHRVGRADDDLSLADRRDRSSRPRVIARARLRPPGRGLRDPSSFGRRRSRARREDGGRARRRSPQSRARAHRPGRNTESAPRATCSVAPSPTSAARGSQSRTSGSSWSISSSRTYGGFDTTRSQGPFGKPMEQVAVHDLDGESGSRGVFACDLERIRPLRRSP